QAEDGIRDATVTGVQTCALPICRPLAVRARLERVQIHTMVEQLDLVVQSWWQDVPKVLDVRQAAGHDRFRSRRPSSQHGLGHLRSEERRVGKECGWWMRGLE